MWPLIIGILIGLFVGWNWTQPEWAVSIQEKLLGIIGYKK